ncbi:MAG: four-carbon acid sugar kinase family protein [Armatimonadetes bacterium]|nr:four-carbon acid sugar kinase family protein [Armatimonadota bacterium]
MATPFSPADPCPTPNARCPTPHARYSSFRWLILADDLTGAADTAAGFRAQGYRTRLQLSPKPSGGEWRAVSLDLNVREEEEGSERVRERVREALANAEGRRVYLKIDSTLRGPVRTMLEAVLPHPGLPQGPALCPSGIHPPLSQRERDQPYQSSQRTPLPSGEGVGGEGTHALVCPAFPAQGRITRGGVQYAHGIPVEAMGPDGKPMSRLTDLFRMAGRECGIVDLKTFGEAASAGSLAKMPDLMIADAESDADLDRWAEIAAEIPGLLCVGSGGFAAALARHQPAQDPVPVLNKISRVSVVAGSAHPKNRAQMRLWNKWSKSLPNPPVMSFLAARTKQSNLDLQIAYDLANLASPYMHKSRGRRTGWILTGGATARAFLEVAEVSILEVGGEIVPGIPWLIARDGRIARCPVATKAGAFGEADALVRISEFLLEAVGGTS